MRTLLDFLADTGRPGCPAAIQGEAEGFLLYAELYAWGKVTIRLIGCGCLLYTSPSPRDA